VEQKLLIFERKKDGIFLGEALPHEAFDKPKSLEKKSVNRFMANEVEQIGEFLEKMGMAINTAALITLHREGLTLRKAKQVYKANKARYQLYTAKLRHCSRKVGYALFNAFLIDCQRSRNKGKIVSYANVKGE
jgi:hypothetical protein